MGADLVVRNARIVLPETGVIPSGMVVRDGRVAALGVPPGDLNNCETLDAGGRIILPGLVDPHVHYGWGPDLEERTKAESAFGVSGGITTFMRYFRRPESYLELMDEQIDLANRLLYQDIAFHLTIFNQDQISEIHQYTEQFGVTSFKVYMNMEAEQGRGILMDLRPGADAEDPHDVDYSTALLNEVFSALAQAKAPLLLSIHCEDGKMLQHGITKARAMGMTGLEAWHVACSDLAEAISITQAALFSRAHGVQVYFPHIGSRAAIQALRDARACGTDFIAETCPHFLAQTIDSPAGVLAKIKPPIRTQDDKEAVWQALNEGLIETVGSDHVPFTLAEKIPGDIWATRTAFGGTGLILPLLLSEGLARKRISLQRLAQITSCNAARAFGLYPRKGTLMPGADADFVIIDEDKTWEIRWEDLLTASDFCVYEGMEVKGAVESVYVRGVKVFDQGKLVGRPGHGQYLRRNIPIRH